MAKIKADNARLKPIAWSSYPILSAYIIDYIKNHDIERTVWWPKPGEATVNRKKMDTGKSIIRAMLETDPCPIEDLLLKKDMELALDNTSILKHYALSVKNRITK